MDMGSEKFDVILKLLLSVFGILVGCKFIFDNKNVVRRNIDFQRKHFGFQDSEIISRVVAFSLGAIAVIVGGVTLIKQMIMIIGENH